MIIFWEYGYCLPLVWGQGYGEPMQVINGRNNYLFIGNGLMEVDYNNPSDHR